MGIFYRSQEKQTHYSKAVSVSHALTATHHPKAQNRLNMGSKWAKHRLVNKSIDVTGQPRPYLHVAPKDIYRLHWTNLSVSSTQWHLLTSPEKPVRTQNPRTPTNVTGQNHLYQAPEDTYWRHWTNPSVLINQWLLLTSLDKPFRIQKPICLIFIYILYIYHWYHDSRCHGIYWHTRPYPAPKDIYRPHQTNPSVSSTQ